MRLVVKVGTSTLTHPTGCLNIRRIEALCKVLADLKNAGNEVYSFPPALSEWASES